jgi:hypothetical protein
MAAGVGLLSACSAASDGGDGTDDSTPTTPDSLSADTVTTAETTAYDFFVGKGLTAVQAAGIVGNLIQESNVVPTAVQSGGPGRGIAQWSVGGRWDTDAEDNVKWYAAKEGLSTTSLTLQLDFVWYELSTFSDYGLASLKKATTVSAATIAFQNDFEGCGECDESQRIAYATAVYDALAGTTSSGTSCYSGTLGKEVANNTCVENSSGWFQCDDGVWVDRYTDKSACSSTYPLE